MQRSRKGEWSAITQVKVVSPEICHVALGQEVFHLEASIATHDNGECVSGVPGSQTIAGHSTVHSGTREFASKIQASFCLSEGPSSLVILMRVSLFSPPKGHPRAVVLHLKQCCKMSDNTGGSYL